MKWLSYISYLRWCRVAVKSWYPPPPPHFVKAFLHSCEQSMFSFSSDQKISTESDHQDQRTVHIYGMFYLFIYFYSLSPVCRHLFLPSRHCLLLCAPVCSSYWLLSVKYCMEGSLVLKEDSIQLILLQCTVCSVRSLITKYVRSTVLLSRLFTSVETYTNCTSHRIHTWYPSSIFRDLLPVWVWVSGQYPIPVLVLINPSFRPNMRNDGTVRARIHGPWILLGIFPMFPEHSERKHFLL